MSVQHSTASRLASVVAARPGLTVSQLMASARVGAGSLYHHLLRLAAAGEVHTIVAGRRRLIYPGPARAASPAEAERAALLRGRTMAKVATAICAQPGVSLPALVEQVGESPRVVYYHAKQLREAGLITSSAPRRYSDLQPAPELPALLRQAQEASPVRPPAASSVA